MSLLIKNCKLVHKGHNVIRNIYVANGKIVKITNDNIKADEIINAKHNFVIPGLIDPHVHFRTPGEEKKEDFLTGSRAAAAGGVTTILDMPNNKPTCTNLKVLKQKRDIAARKSVVNFGFHFGATNDNIKSIKTAKNIASVKVIMGSTTGNLLVEDAGKLYDVFSNSKINAIHAESESLISYFTEKFKKQRMPEVHCEIRNEMVAAEAVSRALTISQYCNNKMYFCHVSTKDELDLLKDTDAYVEVTPHHLFLTKKHMKKLGNFAKMNPPLRSEEDRKALWKAILDGDVHTIGTDHAPHLKEEKKKGYWNAPAGVPGVETRLPLLLNEVNKGNLSLGKVVELCSINPAKIFGIKNKGLIKEGYDADLTIIDMELTKKVRNDNLYTKCGWSPFEGMKLKGWPTTTIVNGKIVFYDNQVFDRKKAKEVLFG